MPPPKLETVGRHALRLVRVEEDQVVEGVSDAMSFQKGQWMALIILPGEQQQIAHRLTEEQALLLYAILMYPGMMNFVRPDEDDEDFQGMIANTKEIFDKASVITCGVRSLKAAPLIESPRRGIVIPGPGSPGFRPRG